VANFFGTNMYSNSYFIHTNAYLLAKIMRVYEGGFLIYLSSLFSCRNNF